MGHPRKLTFAILTCCLPLLLDTAAFAQAQEPPHAQDSLAPAAVAATAAAPVATPADDQTPAREQHTDVDSRTQYPAFLRDSYFGVHLSYLAYNFTDKNLEPGFRSSYFAVPHLAARVDLLGHRFNQYISLQGTYMRPVAYVTYHNVNGDNELHHVWMNFGALLLQGQAPMSERFSAYGEAGWGIVSRRGFETDAGVPVVKNAHYGAAVLGGGLIYHASPQWDLMTGVTYVPRREADNQPASAFASAGFRYNMLPPNVESAHVSSRDDSGYIFPENLVQLEFGTGAGYKVNTFFSDTAHVFWGGNVLIGPGVALHYDRNVYHTKKVFALDLGTSISYWKSHVEHQGFATVSAYPLLRFTLVRTKPADYFVMYSFAGPTYISRVIIDSLGTGGHWTFQDFMGAGAFFGKDRKASFAIKISHYSNGNLFIDNAALKVPVTLSFGYAF